MTTELENFHPAVGDTVVFDADSHSERLWRLHHEWVEALDEARALGWEAAERSPGFDKWGKQRMGWLRVTSDPTE